MLIRALGITIFIVVVFSIINYGVRSYREARVIEMAAAPVLPPPARTAANEFAATGTFAYYPNNVGRQVPYLVYQSAGGGVATKALVFADNSTCVTPRGRYPCPLIAGQLSAYYGQRFVAVSGLLAAEHVLVRRVAVQA